jgi:hypothetical protein
VLFFRKQPPPVRQKITLPSAVLSPIFGKVFYEAIGENLEVTFTILMPRIGEGWQTGVAIDASASMKDLYGQRLIGTLPAAVIQAYVRKKWIYKTQKDGDRLLSLEPSAYEDAINNKYLSWSENLVQEESRKFIHYLADRLDADGGTTVIYWACGNGNEIEVLGDVQTKDCAVLTVDGPQHSEFGEGSKLLPALKYFIERFADAYHGMYIFITDGRLDDLEAVKSYSRDLAVRIQKGQQAPLKCILIGMGSQVNQTQLKELDDLDTQTGFDLWDYKLATDMRQVTEIFAELVDESVIVAPVANIYDDRGHLIKPFTDGLPARVNFTLPQTSRFFELEVVGQAERFRQVIPAP